MTLNREIAKIALYSLASHVDEKPLKYSIVGGLAVQAYAFQAYQNYLRPTIDADILSLNMDFSEFKELYGTPIGKLLKNKFGLGYHVEKGHHHNGVTVLQNHKDDNSKDVFLLHFTRYNAALYKRIVDDIVDKLENHTVDFRLSDIGVTNDDISIKSKISDVDDLSIKVLTPEKIMERKFGRITKKATEYPVQIRSDYSRLQNEIVTDGMSVRLKGNIDSLFEQLVIDSVSSPEKYDAQKDIFDFFLLKSITQ